MGPIRTFGVLAAPLVQPSGQLCVASEPRGTHEDQQQGLLDVHRQVIRRLIADGEQVCPMLIVRLSKRAWHCRRQPLGAGRQRRRALKTSARHFQEIAEDS